MTTTTHPKTTKAYKGMAMEGSIARWYAKTARRDAEFKTLAAKVKETVPAGGYVLEVAPGPGFLSIEIAQLGKYHVTGLDISKTFVEIAQANAREANVSVDFRQGNASDLPFANDTFDFIICTAAFKNFTQPVQAIAEMQRVLKPGGRALIVDLRRDASRAEVYRMVADMHLSWWNTLFTRWAFRFMLLKNAYTPEEIRKMVAQTPFKQCEIRTDQIGMEIWLTK
ncbi:MAG TPA: class I SAM-dependent methyltransferase [Anaerolineae bacterium]|nr:class I SAM-dependent methyltransferase [Anaerolineae bacterium]